MLVSTPTGSPTALALSLGSLAAGQLSALQAETVASTIGAGVDAEVIQALDGPEILALARVAGVDPARLEAALAGAAVPREVAAVGGSDAVGWARALVGHIAALFGI